MPNLLLYKYAMLRVQNLAAVCGLAFALIVAAPIAAPATDPGDTLERELLEAPPVMAVATAERLLEVHIVSHEHLVPAFDRREGW